jgi:serine/threonine protein phosphatase 1
MRTLVIGDIHGGLKALEQALQRAKFHTEQDTLIFLGDYVDGWSESAEVVQYLIDLQNYTDKKHIFLRGNHDKWCEDWLLMGQSPNIWVSQGGKSTLASYIRSGHITSQEHKDFFKNLENYHIDEQNRGFVHGGFISKKGLGHETYQSDYYWDRDMWSLAVLQHNNFQDASPIALAKFRRFEKHKEVYIGHTSTGNWSVKPHYPEYGKEGQAPNGSITVPMNRCNVWNMDTGGGFEGKVTVMDIDTKEFWQSDFVKTLYPDEKGR